MKQQPYLYDVVVVGAGHAAIEAVAGLWRLGLSIAVVTLRKDRIGQMSCNPAIGGVGKGHIVKEVDALGGFMGRLIDEAGIQYRTLNASKGPAVRASRAQADRELYKEKATALLSSLDRVEIIEGEVVDFLLEGKRIEGIRLKGGEKIKCKAVVLTTGTFLRGLMHTGEHKEAGGRKGDKAASSLSYVLEKLGFRLIRLKTGTPPRLKRNTIKYESLMEQPGDVPIKPFSFLTPKIEREQVSCWITKTNPKVHEIIYANRHKSPMYNGQIKSRGPRYCPSIEDKVFRFYDKEHHTIFLEPEGYNSDIVYPNGISTSLPAELQEEFIRYIEGLEQVKILQYGYAVEYDAIDPRQLAPTLESKEIEGLFLAGQINGTSGYEEAAGQGIIAGLNAGLKVLEREPFILSRTESYIGVMIDDLTSLGVDEPYRMFTSRAEHRLVLREDNAVERVGKYALQLGLFSEEEKRVLCEKIEERERLRSVFKNVSFKPSLEINNWLKRCGTAPLEDKLSAEEILKRPQVTVFNLIDSFRESFPSWVIEASEDSLKCVETDIKFSGYIRRQLEEIELIRRSEKLKIPFNFSYDSLKSLRAEAREKLSFYKPANIAQAMKIPGITPSAIAVCVLALKSFKNNGKGRAKEESVLASSK
ncbi:MAG: tRNA uridine-5-carboxymethylaminomethyl(34) synthesis enzyme MnmG [Candidatus Dadabacteria bacterium]|nr:MAG: tRNA uridine-5-carboxymethylaminomethyl(34) synthesis enzyme MnmG [Candidatus Dadabacteria bacterium]